MDLQIELLELAEFASLHLYLADHYFPVERFALQRSPIWENRYNLLPLEVLVLEQRVQRCLQKLGFLLDSPPLVSVLGASVSDLKHVTIY